MDTPAPRLLLIDDDPDDRALAKLILKSELGYIVVDEITDALDFAQACARGGFALVVLEHKLAWADGLSVLGFLKEQWSGIPVVLFTRHGSEEVSAAAARLGVDHYLSKTTGNFLRLAPAVRSALEQARGEAVPARAAPRERREREVQQPFAATASPGPAAPQRGQRGEEDIERRIERLERTNESLQQFASLAAHELQEPVRTMERYARVLKEDHAAQLDEEGGKVVERIAGGARRLQNLVGDLLSLSRMENRQRPFEKVDAEKLLENVLGSLAASIERSDAVVSHAPLPAIHADPVQIERLLQNLISNAIKFRGEEKPRVFVSAARADDHWVFSVHDNGVGIDPLEAESIFTSFKRLRPEVPGSGLGLPLCRRIVERHGGRIWVKSEPGQGSTFYFTLPVGEEDGQEAGRAGASRGAGGSS